MSEASRMGGHDGGGVVGRPGSEGWFGAKVVEAW